MNSERHGPENELQDMEFTNYAKRSVEKVTRDPYFRDSDPEMILDALMNEIRAVSFGDYLKRYIRKKQQGDPAGEAGSETDDTDYLCDRFRENGVPPSFTPTSAKLRALVRNWLTQRTVNRSVVLLLGFALDMPPEDVNEFLAKALREPRLDPKDPFEVICWYCYRYRLPYAVFESLWNRFSADPKEAEEEPLLQLENTVRVRTDMNSIGTEAQLAAYLARLGQTRLTGRQSVSARKQFDRLYREACALAAEMRTEMEEDDARTNAGRYADQISRSDRLFDYQKRELVRKKQEAYRVWTPEEITPADLEDILYSAIPKDRHGNMIPMKESLLNIQFSGKRLNRMHIQEILDGKGAVNRFDLITLCFFTVAGETDLLDEPRDRYDAFIRAANQALKDSDMDPLYVANPYESFVMMCMLTDDPLGSFADVWEMSYNSGL